ncbi:MAG: UDP-N-acetylmuramoyl-L-alanyl-D-glutamate--2,6-diaminopimelate ligase [Nitrospinota bacterium]|nr:UDP-N-acetylmuramoyl-L-alanyl-D-glutamate--2,6-diaminopimelate ligase [Nitrospinota bacterium]
MMQTVEGIQTLVFPEGIGTKMDKHPLRNLSELVKGFSLLNVLGTLDRHISSIAFDSRDVKEGGLFVAIRGLQQDGNRYIADAIQRGASAFITEVPMDQLNGFSLGSKSVSALQVSDAREALSRVSSAFYDHPSKHLNLIGITGTNGKTTLTYILERIYREREETAGVIGTIHYCYGDIDIPAPITTPESLELNRMFHDMRMKGVKNCFLEISSHSLALKRVHGMNFSVGVFTNLTRDHLDFHGTMEHYKNAKKELFRSNRVEKKVLNIDDPVGREILAESGQETLTTAMDRPADVTAEACIISSIGSRFILKTPWGEREIQTHLLGRHNISNLLSATACSLLQGYSMDEIDRGLRSIDSIPGRFERVALGQNFVVMVDYAHTPDALKNALQAARAFTGNRVITVIGCGGDRDPGKRKEMGKTALELSDFAIITSDNPRTEEPEHIIEGILEGVPSDAIREKHYSVSVNRREAIEQAIDRAAEGDTVVIAGKGHEDYQILKKETIHFDDREMARQYLKRKLNID